MAKARKKATDADVLAELTKQAKVRITTMIDLDLYVALKKRAAKDGDGRYQTYLNALLRRALFGPPKEDAAADLFEKILNTQRSLSARLDSVSKIVDEVARKVETMNPPPRAKKSRSGKKKPSDAA